ncbi:MAG: DUF222 domain-containing protein [Thermocrispum sp.]
MTTAAATTAVTAGGDTATPVAIIRAQLAVLREGLTGRTAEAVLGALNTVRRDHDALRLHALMLADRARQEQPTAAGRDTAGALSDTLGIPGVQARRELKQARTLERLPALAAAVESGEVTPDAAAAITRARRQPADIHTLRAAQDDLVALARSQHPDEIAKRARWVVAARPQQLDRQRSRQRADRGLTLRTRDDGMVEITGALLPEAGETWRTILDPLVKRTYRQPDSSDGDQPPQQDPRTGRQRMHDVFATLGRQILSDGRTPEVHRMPARVLVCVDLRTFDPAAHDPQLLDALGIDPAAIRRAATGLLPAGAGLLPETGTLLPAELVRRLATAAGTETIPLLFDGFTPLARGRTRRLADANLRLALVCRDHGCVDCHAPPSWCDADHTTPWEPPHNGRTDPDNLQLRCRPQHVDRHLQLGLDPPSDPDPPRGPP